MRVLLFGYASHPLSTLRRKFHLIQAFCWSPEKLALWFPALDPAIITHAFAVFALFGLVWTIQLVHYPMFKFVEAPHWPRFHQFHSRNITFIVFPLMLIELLTSLKLSLEYGGFNDSIALGCSVATWLLTIFLFVPLHNQVAVRPIPAKLEKLTRLNWLRTLVWTAAAANVFSNLVSFPQS